MVVSSIADVTDSCITVSSPTLKERAGEELESEEAEAASVVVISLMSLLPLFVSLTLT